MVNNKLYRAKGSKAMYEKDKKRGDRKALLTKKREEDNREWNGDLYSMMHA